MRKKPDDRSPPPREPDRDTSSFEQAQGAQDHKIKPNQRNEKLPHERDESARPRDDRMTESAPPSGRQISDAQKDIAEGRVDTDRRGIPNDVPGGRK
jgi:hypothetical protein